MRNNWTTESAKEKILEICGGKISIVEPFEYSNIDTLYEFNCPVHGNFKKSFYSVITSKHPCFRCAPNAKKDWKETLNRIKITHGDKYSYPDFEEYFTPKRKIKILCSDHGLFFQSAQQHIKGNGCPQCYSDKNNITVNRFLIDSIQEHGDRYDYSLIFQNYKNTRSMITIGCVS